MTAVTWKPEIVEKTNDDGVSVSCAVLMPQKIENPRAAATAAYEIQKISVLSGIAIKAAMLAAANMIKAGIETVFKFFILHLCYFCDLESGFVILYLYRVSFCIICNLVYQDYFLIYVYFSSAVYAESANCFCAAFRAETLRFY